MGSTMIQLIQQCTNELGIPTPNTVAGNASQETVQLLALMNAAGYELLRRADWRELTRQHTFYTEAHPLAPPRLRSIIKSPRRRSAGRSSFRK